MLDADGEERRDNTLQPARPASLIHRSSTPWSRWLRARLRVPYENRPSTTRMRLDSQADHDNAHPVPYCRWRQTVMMGREWSCGLAPSRHKRSRGAELCGLREHTYARVLRAPGSACTAETAGSDSVTVTGSLRWDACMVWTGVWQLLANGERGIVSQLS